MLPTKEIQTRLYHCIYRLRQEEQAIRYEIGLEERSIGIRKKIIHAEKKAEHKEDKIVLEMQRDLEALKKDKTEFGKRIVRATEEEMKSLGEKDKVWHRLIKDEERVGELEEEKKKINEDLLKDIDTQLSSLNIAYKTSQKPDFVSNKGRLDVYIRAIKLFNKRQKEKKSRIGKKHKINEELVRLERNIKELRPKLLELIKKEAELSPRIEKADQQVAARLAA